MSDSDHSPLRRFIGHLNAQGALGREVLALELAAEMVAALIETAAAKQSEAEISNLRVTMREDTVAIAMRVRVKGRAWPPRPPLDTELGLTLSEIIEGTEGDAGCLKCRVTEPLSFSSTFAEMLAGLAGRLLKGFPAPLETLRRKDAILKIDFAAMARAGWPELAHDTSAVRLHSIKVSPGRVRLELKFGRP